MRVPHNKKSLEMVLSDFRQVHGNRYDYSLIREYSNKLQKLPIICKEHGIFYQNAHSHLYNKSGCPICANITSHLTQKGKARNGIRKKFYGKATFDMDCTCNGDAKLIYRAWKSMLTRCFGGRADYSDCDICTDWLTFSNFYNWAVKRENGFKESYQLDKDILVKGNKVYSPDTCCFVPREINDMLVKGNSQKRKHLIGVTKRGNMFYASHGISLLPNFDVSRFGYYKSEIEAYNAYKESKENYIKQVADKYYKEGKITDKVHNALVNYKVDIND